MNINRIYRLLAHKLRVQMLVRMTEADEPQSPVMLAKDLMEPLANASYHMKMLANDGLVTLVATRPVRGAVEHFYEPVEGVAEILEAAQALSNVIEERKVEVTA